MKPASLIILILLIMLPGCARLSPSTKAAPSPASLTPGPTRAWTMTPELPSTATSTSTPLKTRTAEPSPIPTFTPGNTPTYDPDAARTITPVSAAVCPVVNASYQPAFADQVVDGAWYLFDLSGPILDTLNQGARLPALKRAVSKATYDGKLAEIPPEAIYAKDVTGDGVPEVIYDEDWFIIYTCQESRFREILKWNPGTTNFVDKPVIADMNMDGLAEITVPTYFYAGYVIEYYFNILRWNGTDFINLIPEQEMTFDGNIEWSVRDTDGNSKFELVVRNWPPTSPDAVDHGPWRHETTTLTWNGFNFVGLPMVLDPPEYRFQAVQDGDRAAQGGDYQKAIEFYNQAITDPNLKGWGYSIQHQIQRQQAHSALAMGTITPTPLPLDPNETSDLKAYARFRILMAHVMLHEDALAESDYQALQDDYPPGKAGSVYAHMGKLFWEGYEKEHNVTAGCDRVIGYVSTNEQQVLDPIQGGIGFQNLYYEAKDMCPY